MKYSDCVTGKQCPGCTLKDKSDASVAAVNDLLDYVDQTSQDTSGKFESSDVQRFMKRNDAPVEDQAAITVAAHMIVEGECTTSLRYEI